MTEKVALCIKNDVITTLKLHGLNGGSLQIGVTNLDGLAKIAKDWETELVPRSVCDHKTVIDKERRQLLPYFALVRKNEEGKNEVYTYLRGKAGDEGRLHDLYSVGLGGHVDSQENTNLIAHLAAEAARELKEEAGIDLTINQIYKEMDRGLFLVADSAAPVEQVHFGLFFVIVVPFDTVVTPEEGAVEKGDWMSVKAVTTQLITGTQFETWTQYMIQHVLDQDEPINPKAFDTFGFTQ